jgi:hypothetical protein
MKLPSGYLRRVMNSQREMLKHAIQKSKKVTLNKQEELVKSALQKEELPAILTVTKEQK